MDKQNSRDWVICSGSSLSLGTKLGVTEMSRTPCLASPATSRQWFLCLQPPDSLLHLTSPLHRVSVCPSACPSTTPATWRPPLLLLGAPASAFAMPFKCGPLNPGQMESSQSGHMISFWLGSASLFSWLPGHFLPLMPWLQTYWIICSFLMSCVPSQLCAFLALFLLCPISWAPTFLQDLVQTQLFWRLPWFYPLLLPCQQPKKDNVEYPCEGTVLCTSVSIVEFLFLLPTSRWSPVSGSGVNFVYLQLTHDWGTITTH